MSVNKSLQSVVVRDENGNLVGVLLDGSVYRIQTINKVLNASGTQINPATEGKQDDAITQLTSIAGEDFATETTLLTRATDAVLQAVRDRIGEVSATPTANTLQDRLKEIEATLTSLDGKDYATQTTLASVLTKLTEIDTVLDAIDGKVATETTSQAIRDRIGEVSATPAVNTLQDRLKEIEATLTSIEAEDFSTETTLSSALTKLTEIDTVLDSIKDVDGIKKITDQLPAGTNEIGKVAQGTKANSSDAWPQYLVDSTGNIIAVILDGAVYRLQVESKIARASDSAYINPSTEETLASIKDTDGIKKITDELPAGTQTLGNVKITGDDGVTTVEVHSRGTDKYLEVGDPFSHEILLNIYHEIRKLNEQIKLITDEEFEDEQFDQTL